MCFYSNRICERSHREENLDKNLHRNDNLDLSIMCWLHDCSVDIYNV